jgi:hypothetical protein
MPLDCVLGDTCVIATYPDVDAGDAASDYRCEAKTTDGHNGTDFALLSFEHMQDGARVLAAASGRVTAIRNMLPDQLYAPEMELNGQDCGNAVRIDHGNGYQTIYCHLKSGSVQVIPEQTVQAGQMLGEVGLSGRTTFPHLHLTIMQGDNVIDPFAPDQTNDCKHPDQDLWLETPTYFDAGLFTAGVSNRVPDMEDIQSGAAQLSTLGTSEPMVLFGYAFHGDPEDTLELALSGPSGNLFQHTARLESAQDAFFRAFGMRSPDGGWPEGRYEGTVQLIRKGAVMAVHHTNITVE